MYRIITGQANMDKAFDSYFDLVNWLSQYNISQGSKIVGNSYLRNCGVLDTDVCVDLFSLVPRTRRILDDEGRNIYDELLKQDVLSHVFDAEYQAKLDRARWYRKPKHLAEFRREPVHHVHKLRGYMWWRNPHTYPEMRDTTDPEVREFRRGCRGKNLPSLCDDLTVSAYSDKSWKQTTRDRHQWERGIRNSLKSRGKGMYVIQPDESMLDMEDSALTEDEGFQETFYITFHMLPSTYNSIYTR